MSKAMIVLVGLFGPMLVLASAQMVPLAILLAMVSAAMLLMSRPVTLRLSWPLLISAVLTLCYLALADLWTPLGENAERALRAGLLVVCSALAWIGLDRLDSQTKQQSAIALCSGIVFVLLWLWVERMTDNWLLRQLSDKPNLEIWTGAYNRALNTLTVIGPILAGTIWSKNRVLAVIVAIMPVTMGILLSVSNTAVLAAIVGPIVMAIAAWRAKFVAAGMAAALFAGAIFGPIVFRDAERITPIVEYTVNSLVFSFQHRIVTWHYTATMIDERPLFGWGARSARELPDAGTTIYEFTDRIDPPWPELILSENADYAFLIPLHPHNALLQARLELGLIGTMLLLGATALALLKAVSGSGRARNAAFLGSLAAGITVWCLSVGLWQSWWIATLGIALAVSRLVPEENR